MSKRRTGDAAAAAAAAASGVQVLEVDGGDDSAQEDEDDEPLVPEGSVPEYLAEAFGDALEEDGLVVLGKGMGWLPLLASFCRYYGSSAATESSDNNNDSRGGAGENSATSQHCPRPPRPLVIVLGLGQKDAGERGALLRIMQSWGTPASELPTFLNASSSSETTSSAATATVTSVSGVDTAATTSSDRKRYYYGRRGIVAVSSRILIVDLLSGVLRPQDVTGFLVAHAETVTEQSTEAFILRIFYGATAHSLGKNDEKKSGDNDEQRRRRHFIKAFTDRADSILHSAGGSFGAVDKVLKACYVRRLYLWPRFHFAVREELEGGCGNDDTNKQSQQPVVTELHQPLSALQQRIQAAVLVAMKQCLEQLKAKTPLVEWNTTWAQKEVSMENCLHLDKILSKQLSQDWHRIGPEVKQYVQDLRTLQTLLHAILQYDCVSFWNLLTNLRTMSAKTRHPSMWLLTKAGHDIFRIAKQRVYRIQPGKTITVTQKDDETSSSQGSAKKTTTVQQVGILIPVLEPNPKWKLLEQVLKEIRQDYDEKYGEHNDSGVSFGPVNVLVMVQDDRTLGSISNLLQDGAHKTMLERWKWYLEGINDDKRSRIDDVTAMPEEDRLLFEEHSRVRNVLNNEMDQPSPSPSPPGGAKKRRRKLNEVPAYIKKRRRIAQEKGRGDRIYQADDLEREGVLQDAIEATEHEMAESQEQRQRSPQRQRPCNSKSKKRGKSDDSPCDDHNDDVASEDDEYDAMFRVTLPNELRVLVRSYSRIDGGENWLLLQETRPQYVVLYDTEVSFVRAVEIYSSLRNAGPVPFGSVNRIPDPVRVYVLMFEASAEEKMFKKTLEKEQNAFERLIEHKKVMPPPALQTNGTQEMQLAMQHGRVEGTYMDGTLPLAFDGTSAGTSSRRGRGKLDRSKERRDIAVDVREFRSALPSILHQGGMRLAPVTLTVGDFVLSNVHCVERKSIGDLYGSFQSGRLYTQAESMCKYYKCPCLLIEFDPAKSFCLQNVNDIGPTIRTDSICSKMAVLMMHFPKLRILWSKSPHETLKLFRDLKVNHDEVDVERAVEIGRNESVDALLQPDHTGNDGDVDKKKAGEDGGVNTSVATEEGDDDDDDVVVPNEDVVNEDGRSMLLRLPGVNVHVARRILQNCDSLSDLASMPREQLRRVAGPVVGQKLFTFFQESMGRR